MSLLPSPPPGAGYDMSTCQAGPAEAPPMLLPEGTLKMVIADPQRLLAANTGWLPTPAALPPSAQMTAPEV